MDPYRTGTNCFIGQTELRDRRMESPGRSTLSLVDQQPGWLLEANAVLHPRESEYAVQYVVERIPLTDNRSPSFSHDIETEYVQEMNLSRGCVRPSFSLDISAGADLWRRDRMWVRIQGDVLNLTDRLNVITFAGVFSGTALGPPRTAAVRMVLEF